MSVKSLATGDTVSVYQEAADRWTDGQRVTLSTAGVDCAVQMLDATESVDLMADGAARGVQILFSFDPGIDQTFYLQHTARNDLSLTTPRWFRVIGSYEEGRPGRSQLWVVLGEELTAAGAPTVV